MLVGLLLAGAARAADRYFLTSDGVRLHYTENGHGRTVVMVTHDEKIAARAPRIIHMRDGSVTSDGAPVRQVPSSPEVVTS